MHIQRQLQFPYFLASLRCQGAQKQVEHDSRSDKDTDRQPQRQRVTCTCVIFIIRHGDAPWQLPNRAQMLCVCSQRGRGAAGNPSVQVAACTQLGVAGQLWICLYLFMLMRRSDTPETTTTTRQQQPQLIKHLHAHKTSTCILYLLEFLSCRYTSNLCLLFSLSLTALQRKLFEQQFYCCCSGVVCCKVCQLRRSYEQFGTCWHLVTSARHKARNKWKEEATKKKLCLNNVPKGF